jgi:hypothetical protein
MNIQFLNAVLWNTINVFLYKILLQTHQVCLFYIISKELFGVSGTIFSSVYFLISMTNFGFDYSLFSFYQQYSSSQQQFKKLINQYMVRLCITLSIILGCFIFRDFLAQFGAINFFVKNIPYALLPCIASIFITESLKKSLETLAQLSFLNKSITILEISTIVTYLSIVWCLYFIRGTIDLYGIFIPMMLTSCIELILLIKRLYLFYQSLPIKNEQPRNLLDNPSIISNQLVNYINQITKSLFSPNFLILFLAYRLGMVKAGYIKLFTDIIILLYMLLNRCVGTPSGALLSRLPQGTILDQQAIKQAFLKITNAYIQLLYALAITIAAAIAPCFLKSSCFHPTITINILLFILAGFIEYIFITYEKMFITQNASKSLALINAISATSLIVSINYFSQVGNLNSSQLTLLPIILIRLATVGTVALVAYKKWSIFPSLRMHYKTAIISFATSLFCLFLHCFL